MTQFEFETRTGVNVDYKEFEAINEVYMNSDLDKDAFCKFWCKMNLKRVSAAKAEKKAEEEKKKLLDKLYCIADLRWCLSGPELYTKLAPEYINYKDQMMLEELGIEMRFAPGAYGLRLFKTIGDVCYEVEKYIKKVLNS